MSLNLTIKKIKSIYKNHDKLEEILKDLNDDICIDYWANKFCNDDFGNNKELSKELFKIYTDTCESSHMLNSIAYDISKKDILNDKDWAKELYIKAINLSDEDILCLKAITCNIASSESLNDKQWARSIYKKISNNLNELSDYNNLISSINTNIEDKNWVLDLIKQAKEALLLSDDKFEFAGYCSEVYTLALNIADVNIANDKESAKVIFEIIKEYENINELLEAGRTIKEIYKDEDTYVETYMNECLEKVIEIMDDNHYCDVYDFIKNDMEDNHRAEIFKNEFKDDIQKINTCEPKKSSNLYYCF
ncbi:MAG: hypothetical protein CL624_07315 [Arcobacter sp.]|nr:hypothetical protein [Arcobacter sp.]|tara:strand:- start:141 stop:1058 length:918 start_codon:yes stop_codon:yes gene_type:complete